MADMTMIDRVNARVTAENLDMERWGQRAGEDNPKDNPCGTTFCYAGHTVLEAGYELDWYPVREYFDDGPVVRWEAYRTTSGDDIRDLAQSLLGLTDMEVDAIFFETELGNDVDVLKAHVHKAVTEPGYAQLVLERRLDDEDY